MFREARYQDGGTGLRNQQSGGLLINGVDGTPIKAYVYWAIITAGPGMTPQNAIKIQRLEPTKSAVKTLKGIVVGTGATPVLERRHHHRLSGQRAADCGKGERFL